MAQQHIDFGAFPNDPSADPIRAAFEKIQRNFDELFNAQLATGVDRITTGAGLTQNRQTGNVTIVANIPNITIQTTSNLLVGVGVANSNTATISSYSTPFVLNLSNSISTGNANITNIRVSNIAISGGVGSSINPNLDGLYTLGTSTYRWKDAYISDSVVLGTSATLTPNGAAVVATTFEAKSTVVTGGITLNGVSNVANIPIGNIPNLSVSNITASNNMSATGNITIGGNATVTGRTTTGTLTTTANANVGNLGTAGLIVATGNITGGNLVTGGVINATGNATAGNINTGGVIVATGNITGNNFITAGLVSATGNVSGGNLVTAGNAVVTGTITGGNITAGTTVKAQIGTITANATIGNNLAVSNLVTANTVNVNVAINTANLIATGYATITGNLSAGNITSVGALAAASGAVTGNLIVGNLETTSSIKTGTTFTATGNITGGNLITGGLIDATGNIKGANLITGGLIDATGNIKGANLITGGILSVTGTATVGNVSTAGFVTATGNVTGGNLITANAVNGGSLTITANGSMNNLAVTNLITAATGNFTTVNASGNVTVGNISTAGTVNAATQVLTPLVRVSNANITGDVDNTVVVSNVRAGGSANIVANAKIGGTLNVTGNTTLSSNLVVSVNAGVTGNLTVSGNTSTNNLSVTSYVGSNLIPASNVTYDLGSPTHRWRDLYLSGTTLNFPTTTISSTDGDIIMDSVIIDTALEAAGIVVDDTGVLMPDTGTISFAGSPTELSPTSLSIGGIGATSAVSLNFTNNMLQSDKAIAAPVIQISNYITVQQINLGPDAKIASDAGGRVVVNSLVSQDEIVAQTLSADSVDSPTITLSGVTISSDGSKVLVPSMEIEGEGTFNSLVVTESADVGSLTATTVDGKITDPDQPFITQLDNLKEVTVDVLNVNTLDVAENATVQGTISAAEVSTDKVTYITNTVVLPAPGSSGSFIFNDNGNAAAVPGMNFDTKNQLLSLSGSISSGNLTSTGVLAVTANAQIDGNLKLANLADLGSIVSRGAAAIQGNLSAGNITTKSIDGTIITISGNVSGANLISSGVIKAPTSDIGNLFAKEGNVSGNHFIGGFANIQGGALIKGDANIVGSLGGVTQLTTSGLANLASMLVVGATELKAGLTGKTATFSGNVTVGNLDLGTLKASSIDLAKGGITGGTFTATLFSGNGASITNIDGSKVSKVGNSGYADLATAAAEAYKVTGSNVTGVVANASYADDAAKAKTATTADLANAIAKGSYANITGVGDLGSLKVTGTATADKFSGDGSLLSSINGANVGTVTLAKRVTENAQSNITSVGTLYGLNIGYGTGGDAQMAKFTVDGNTTSGATVTVGKTHLYVAGNISSGSIFSGNGAGLTSVPVDWSIVTNKPSIPSAQVNSDWNATTGVAQILNKPTIPSAYTPPQNIGTGDSPQFNSLGIGIAATGTAGEIRATNNITAYASSDRRLKEDIRNIDNALGKVRSLNGVYFNWTQSYIEKHGGEDEMFIRRGDTGIIAQEVEQVLPEIVATRPDGFKAVRYEKMVGLFIEAIKELDDKVELIKKHLGI